MDWEKYITALLVFAGIVGLGELARRLLVKFKGLAHVDDRIQKFLLKSIRVGTIIFGSISFLGTIGVDISALVTGLGLTGFAVGLALKDVISNVIAGIMLIIYRPFAKGDLLEVKSFRGTVNSVDLRYTTLDNDGQRIFIPNSLMFKETITVLESGKASDDESNESTES